MLDQYIVFLHEGFLMNLTEGCNLQYKTVLVIDEDVFFLLINLKRD